MLSQGCTLRFTKNPQTPIFLHHLASHRMSSESTTISNKKLREPRATFGSRTLAEADPSQRKTPRRTSVRPRPWQLSPMKAPNCTTFARSDVGGRRTASGKTGGVWVATHMKLSIYIYNVPLFKQRGLRTP